MPAKKYDPSKTYSVTLKKPIEYAPGLWARPGDEISMTGEKLADLPPDAVETATEQ